MDGKEEKMLLAVRVGFEPTEPVKVQRFSRPPDSTALAPHRFLNVSSFSYLRNVSHSHFQAFLTSDTDLTQLASKRLTACLFASRFVCAYRIVVLMSAWPRSSFTVTRSVP